LPRPPELLLPRPRHWPRVALAASLGAHLLLLLLGRIEGRVPRLPAPPPPSLVVIDLPPVSAARPPVDRAEPRVATPAPSSHPATEPAEPTVLPVPAPAGAPVEAADTASQPGGPGLARIGPGLAEGRLWVQPLPLPPKELAQRIERTHVELVDSAVTQIIQAFLDSMALDPASRAAKLPDWTTTIAGTKFGLDSKHIYIAGLKIPAALLALLPLPGANESRAFDRSQSMYDDLRYAATRSANLEEFKRTIREIRERTDRERELRRNQRTPPPPAPPSGDTENAIP
jgi:hypothetical protein